MQGEPAWWRAEISVQSYADFKDDVITLTQPQMHIPSRPSKTDRTDLKLAVPHHLWPTYSFSSHLNDSFIPHLTDPNLSTLPSCHPGNNRQHQGRQEVVLLVLSLKSLSTLCDRQPDDNIGPKKSRTPPPKKKLCTLHGPHWHLLLPWIFQWSWWSLLIDNLTKKTK